MRAIPSMAGEGVPLRRLIESLGSAYLELLHDPAGSTGSDDSPGAAGRAGSARSSRLARSDGGVTAEPIVREMVIVEPEDDSETYPGDLVFLVGARGDAAAPAFERIAGNGAAAIAVKGIGAESPLLLEAARRTRTAALNVHPEMQWEQLGSMVREILASAQPGAPEHSIDLFTLAQTISMLAGGPVSIEDNDFRVLAYSTQGDEVDDLRRLSILGRQGPGDYLRKLSELGVYERLRRGEEMVVVSEHPELGIKARLALGVNYGNRHLGVVWVQREESVGSGEQRSALLGAARLVGQLIASGHRAHAGPALFRNGILEDLLDGNAGGAGSSSEEVRGAVIVAVFEPVPEGPADRSPPAGRAAPDAPPSVQAEGFVRSAGSAPSAHSAEPVEQPAGRSPERAIPREASGLGPVARRAAPAAASVAEPAKSAEDVVVAVANLIAVQAESYRRGLLMTIRRGRIVVALPDAAPADVSWLESLARRVVAGQSRFAARISVGVGERVSAATHIPESYASAVAVLDLLKEGRRPVTARRRRSPGTHDVMADGAPGGTEAGAARSSSAAGAAESTAAVGTAESFRNQLLVRRVLIAAADELRHPLLEELAADQPVIAGTLLDFLASGGRFAAVALADDIHVNTVRYRVRRGAEFAGLDLEDPEHRLAAELVLRRLVTR